MRAALKLGAASALWLARGSAAAAQGCAMCKSSIAAQTDAVVSSINAGILILLVPPLLILSGILFVAVRQRE